MKNIVDEKGRDWHKKLYKALWADRTSPKRVIGMTLFELVHGVKTQLSLPLELATLKLKKVIEDKKINPLEKKILFLLKIEEERGDLVDHITEHQAKVKNVFDRRARPRKFIKGDKVLLWDK